jgi:hypothetical protein
MCIHNHVNLLCMEQLAAPKPYLGRCHNNGFGTQGLIGSPCYCSLALDGLGGGEFHVSKEEYSDKISGRNTNREFILYERDYDKRRPIVRI